MFKRKVRGRLASGVALPGLVLALSGLERRHPGRGAPPSSSRSRRASRRPSLLHAASTPGASPATAMRRRPSAAPRRSSSMAPPATIIYGMNENAPRHPASVTKVMTLYLLFEQLEKGKLSLDDEIPISAHAAAQAPSKLGLRPGQSIRVEDAIKAIVTKSANDIAVAVAEAVGGTESDFAEQMTSKAHALGMSPHRLCQRLRPAQQRADHHRRRPRLARARRSRRASRATTAISRCTNSPSTASTSITTTT